MIIDQPYMTDSARRAPSSVLLTTVTTREHKHPSGSVPTRRMYNLYTTYTRSALWAFSGTIERERVGLKTRSVVVRSAVRGGMSSCARGGGTSSCYVHAEEEEARSSHHYIMQSMFESSPWCYLHFFALSTRTSVTVQSYTVQWLLSATIKWL